MASMVSTETSAGLPQVPLLILVPGEVARALACSHLHALLDEREGVSSTGLWVCSHQSTPELLAGVGTWVNRGARQVSALNNPLAERKSCSSNAV